MTEKVQFTAENFEKFNQIVKKYEIKRSALLPVLYLAQDQFGFISEPVMHYVAELLDIPPVHVYEAVSFYVMYKRRDMGKYCVQVCNNVTCSMMGSVDILKHLKNKLKVEQGAVTPDGKFSLIPVQCLGACDVAPVIQVNEDFCNNMSLEKVDQLIEKLALGDEAVLGRETL